MHLVGFIIRIYHDARSPERQIQKRMQGVRMKFNSELPWHKQNLTRTKGF